jgi:hypothetical protein
MRTPARVTFGIVSVGFAMLVTVSSSISARQRPDSSRLPDAQALASFDDCIQERFKAVDERFGMARIMKPGATHGFLPKNLREAHLIRELESANLQVILYLADRWVLNPMPGPDSGYADADQAFGVIQGPVRITNRAAMRSSGAPDAPPHPRDLWDDSQRAMIALSANAESYEFSRPGWKFIARPVRASSEKCLRCHSNKVERGYPAVTSTTQIGDALAAVLYGYRPLR